METFVGERIEVEKAETSPCPVRFQWHGETHEIVEVLEERIDTGFGSPRPGTHRWNTRRHRRYYVVRDSEGHFFEMYLDYADRKKRTWWLVKRWD